MNVFILCVSQRHSVGQRSTTSRQTDRQQQHTRCTYTDRQADRQTDTNIPRSSMAFVRVVSHGPTLSNDNAACHFADRRGLSAADISKKNTIKRLFVITSCVNSMIMTENAWLVDQQCRLVCVSRWRPSSVSRRTNVSSRSQALTSRNLWLQNSYLSANQFI